MPPNNQPQKRQPAVPELTPEIIQSILQRETLKLENEAKKIAYDGKKLEYDCRVAEKAIQHNADYQKSRPNETRKTVTRIAYIALGFLIVFLSFIAYLVMNDKTAFVNDFLHGLSYVATSFASYWIGTRNKKQQKLNSSDNEIVEAQTID